MYMTKSPKMERLLRISNMIMFLESSTDKKEKVDEIKAARSDGIIDEEEAVELACEYC